MSFNVKVSSKAKADIGKRPSRARKSIEIVLRDVVAMQPRSGDPLGGPPDDLYSLCCGEEENRYRIVYQVVRGTVDVLHVYGPGE